MYFFNSLMSSYHFGACKLNSTRVPAIISQHDFWSQLKHSIEKEIRKESGLLFSRITLILRKRRTTIFVRVLKTLCNLFLLLMYTKFIMLLMHILKRREFIKLDSTSFQKFPSINDAPEIILNYLALK